MRERAQHEAASRKTGEASPTMKRLAARSRGRLPVAEAPAPATPAQGESGPKQKPLVW